MSSATLLIVWLFVFLAVGAVVMWRLGRLIERRWPAIGIPCFALLGGSVLFLSWTGAAQLAGDTQPGCPEVFGGTIDLDEGARAELLARCVATAGEDEMSTRTVMRRFPTLYPLSVRPKALTQ
jgi:hypothetical protein